MEKFEIIDVEKIIPQGTKEIGFREFDGCAKLTEVDIPNGVEVIGDFAFRGCRALTSIVLPETVSMIGFSLLKIALL